MGPYLLRRLVMNIPVLLGITIATYAIVSFAPGDPVTAMLDPVAIAELGPEWVEQQKRELGLDDPAPVRYLKWVGQVAQGNLGFSISDRRPVADKIGERIVPTLRLMATVLAIGVIIGVPIGVMSALRQYSFLDYAVTLFGLAAVSIPSFFLALGAIYVFSVQLGWLPASGMRTIGQAPTFNDQVKHLILPATVLGLNYAAPLIRYTRSSMLNSIREDYVTVARAKGLREGVVVTRHALRNVLIPLVTVIALDFPKLLAGTIIIEQVLAWPGMGTLAITAVLGRDYPVLMAINLISAVLILGSNLLADMIYAVVDPRIRYS